MAWNRASQTLAGQYETIVENGVGCLRMCERRGKRKQQGGKKAMHELSLVQSPYLRMQVYPVAQDDKYEDVYRMTN